MPAAPVATTRASEATPIRKVMLSPACSSKVSASSLTADFPLYLQPKLSISWRGDPCEQEADRTAQQIMHMPEPTVRRHCVACAAGGPLRPARERKESVTLSRKAEGDASGEASVLVRSVLRSPRFIYEMNMLLQGIPDADIRLQDMIHHHQHKDDSIELKRNDSVLVNPRFSEN